MIEAAQHHPGNVLQHHAIRMRLADEPQTLNSGHDEAREGGPSLRPVGEVEPETAPEREIEEEDYDARSGPEPTAESVFGRSDD